MAIRNYENQRLWISLHERAQLAFLVGNQINKVSFLSRIAFAPNPSMSLNGNSRRVSNILNVYCDVGRKVTWLSHSGLEAFHNYFGRLRVDKGPNLILANLASGGCCVSRFIKGALQVIEADAANSYPDTRSDKHPEREPRHPFLRGQVSLFCFILAGIGFFVTNWGARGGPRGQEAIRISAYLLGPIMLVLGIYFGIANIYSAQ